MALPPVPRVGLVTVAGFVTDVWRRWFQALADLVMVIDGGTP